MMGGLVLLLSLSLGACGDPTATTAPVTTVAATSVATVIPTASNPTAASATTRAVTTVAATTAAPASTTNLPAATTGSATSAPTAGQAKLSSAPLLVTKANGETINMTVELARTSAEQETGLMGRTSLPPDTGMLFIFPSKVQLGFWMKDTLLPLSIAWIDEKGKIVEIQDMEAKSLDVHTPAQSYIWALEVPKGYFSSKGIVAGNTVKLVTQ